MTTSHDKAWADYLKARKVAHALRAEADAAEAKATEAEMVYVKAQEDYDKERAKV